MNPSSAMTGPSSPEMELLCACIRSRILSSDLEEKTALGRPIDWPRFLSLATNHHVIPLVYKVLKTIPARVGGPSSQWRTHLRSLSLAISAYNLRAAVWLHQLQALLESNDIHAIPVKGPSLALLAYGDLSLRQFEDLDLIVPKNELLQAITLLEAEGYVTRELSPGVSRSRYLNSLQNWSLHKSGKPPLDIKSVLASHTISRPHDIGFLARECRWLEIGDGRRLFAPGPEAMLLAVCLDGANEMWFKLSSIADAAALLTKFPEADWEGLLQEASRMGQRRSLLVGAQVAKTLLDCPLPPAFLGEAESDRIALRIASQAVARLRSLAPRHTSIARQSLFAFQTRERIGDRGRFLARLLFVPSAFELNAIPLPDALAPLYALMRPFRLAWDVWGRGGKHRRLRVHPERKPGSGKVGKT